VGALLLQLEELKRRLAAERQATGVRA